MNVVVRKGPGGQMQVLRQPVPEVPAALKQVIAEMK